ncbi:hypothetical protein BJX61DRAFT_536466 [Aspergillus egyptiacus]|nr:hypothetical protein BJX61DRAFT_536466 [Aspergillus egyptiacus]
MVNVSAAVCGVAAAFLTMSIIAVILRCYVRLCIVKSFGWDDSVMILAMLFFIAYCGCTIGGSIWGTGKYLSDLAVKQQYWFFCKVTYPVASVLAKVSVCIFLRVIPVPSYRITLYTVTAFAVVTGIIFFVVLMIQCSPVSYWWTQMSGDTDGECGHLYAVSITLYVFSGASVVFDMTVGILPVMLVRKLQMNRSTKAAIVVLLGMACVASIAIIVRMPFVQSNHNPEYLYTTDKSQVVIWSAVETGLSITAGSLATIRPLFRVFFKNNFNRGYVGEGFDASTANPAAWQDAFELDRTSADGRVSTPPLASVAGRNSMDRVGVHRTFCISSGERDEDEADSD